MIGKRKQRPLDLAVLRNAELLGDLLAVSEAYAEVLEALTLSPDDPDARDDARSVARMAAGALLHDSWMRSSRDVHGVLPPGLDPRAARWAVEAFGESALLLAADGPASGLALDGERAALVLEAPEVAAWISRMDADGEPWTEESLAAGAVVARPDASDAEVEGTRATLRDLLPRVAERYPALHVGAPNGAAAPGDAEEALGLAREIAATLRGVAAGGDVRRFPEEFVYALAIVLPRVFQSLTFLAWGEQPREDLLAPAALHAMFEDAPHIPAVLAGS